MTWGGYNQPQNRLLAILQRWIQAESMYLRLEGIQRVPATQTVVSRLRQASGSLEQRHLYGLLQFLRSEVA